MLVGQKIAKRLLNCEANDLKRWREQGMPYETEVGGVKYDMNKVHRWHAGEDFPKKEQRKKPLQLLEQLQGANQKNSLRV